MQLELTVPTLGIAWAFGPRHYVVVAVTLISLYAIYYIRNVLEWNPFPCAIVASVFVLAYGKFWDWIRPEVLEVLGDAAGETAAIRFYRASSKVPEPQLPKVTRKVVLVAEGKVYEVFKESGWSAKLRRAGIANNTIISVSEDTHYPQGIAPRTDTRIDISRRSSTTTHDQIWECVFDVRSLCFQHRIKYEQFHEDNPETADPAEEDHPSPEEIEQRYIEEEIELAAHLSHAEDQHDIGCHTYQHD